MPKVKYTNAKGLHQEAGTGINTGHGVLTLPKMYGGVQRSAVDAALTVGEDTTLLVLALDVSASGKLNSQPVIACLRVQDLML
jgi:hypothetical protein